MTDKHTPTPWKSDGYGALVGPDGKTITVWGLGIAHGQRSENTEANARHIVKCVNYHDRLVEALREAKEFMEIELDGEAYGQCMQIAHSISKLLSELELDTKKESE